MRPNLWNKYCRFYEKDFAEQLNDYKETLDKYWRAITRYEKQPKTDKPNYAIIEVAYWSGRVEALKRFISNNKRDIPAFFSPYALKPVNRMASLNNIKG